jgi:hypothetical protein
MYIFQKVDDRHFRVNGKIYQSRFRMRSYGGNNDKIDLISMDNNIFLLEGVSADNISIDGGVTFFSTAEEAILALDNVIGVGNFKSPGSGGSSGPGVTVDTILTETSTNPVSSAGIFAFIQSALSTTMTQSDIDKILAQLSSALLSSGVSLDNIDNIISALRTYISGLENPTTADISYAINLALSTSTLRLTEDQVRAIVSESISGFIDFAKHEEVDVVARALEDHSTGDIQRWAEFNELKSEVRAFMDTYGTSPKWLDETGAISIESEVQSSSGWTADTELYPLGGEFRWTWIQVLLSWGYVEVNGVEEKTSKGLNLSLAGLDDNLTIAAGDIIKTNTVGISDQTFVPYRAGIKPS